MSIVEVPLTRGQVAVIDEEDAPLITQYKWMANWTGRLWYAVRYRRLSDPPGGHFIYMHEMICPGDHTPDHIDRDTLNNRRSNLRPATRSQNQFNAVKPKNNTSGIKGVSWHKASNKWRATICVNYRHIQIGVFETKEAAAEAYAKAAAQYHGEFAA